MDLGKQLRLSDIEAIYWAIQTSLASHKQSPVEQICAYMLPEEIDSSNDVYSNLVCNTTY